MRDAIAEDFGWPDKWCDHSWWPEIGCRYCNSIKQRMCMNCKQRLRLTSCPHHLCALGHVKGSGGWVRAVYEAVV